MRIADLVTVIEWGVQAVCGLVLFGLLAWLAYSARRMYFRTRRRTRATMISLIAALLGWWIGGSLGSMLPIMRIVVDEYDFSSAAYATGAFLMLAGAWLGMWLSLRIERPGDRSVCANGPEATQPER